jgi:hypothetical protein
VFLGDFMSMTSGQFIKIGQKIAGKGHGYQSILAVKIGVCLRQVQRYASGDSPITATIENLVRELEKGS